ncbi:MAG: hypothetical protein KGL46_05340 [Hyphomicrobiales bacterium]|nr:hypothetical protein [Hyphomicrobiales bacterium]
MRAAPFAFVLCLLASAAPARADDDDRTPPAGAARDRFGALESKYLFGFSYGTDLGEVGDLEIGIESGANLGRRTGRYTVFDSEIGIERVPIPRVEIELAAHMGAFRIKNAPGYDDITRTAPTGIANRWRFQILQRGRDAPFGLAFSVEPTVSRRDSETGRATTSVSGDIRLLADYEFVARRLYGAINLGYQPQAMRTPFSLASDEPPFQWRHYATLSASAAFAWRVAPNLTAGGEVSYQRAHDTLGLARYAGQALYAGPTLYWKFQPNAFFAATAQPQLWGRAVGENHTRDLTNFTAARAKARLEFEF